MGSSRKCSVCNASKLRAQFLLPRILLHVLLSGGRSFDRPPIFLEKFALTVQVILSRLKSVVVSFGKILYNGKTRQAVFLLDGRNFT